MWKETTLGKGSFTPSDSASDNANVHAKMGTKPIWEVQLVSTQELLLWVNNTTDNNGN